MLLLGTPPLVQRPKRRDRLPPAPCAGGVEAPPSPAIELELCAPLLRDSRRLCVSLASGEQDCELLSSFLAEALADSLGQRTLTRFLERTRVGPHVRRLTLPPLDAAAGRGELLRRGVLLKACISGRLAAACDLSLACAPSAARGESRLDAPLGAVVLQNLCVAPDLRRGGVGSQLLAAAVHFAAADLYLHSRLSDDASAGALYRRAGFVAVAEHTLLEGLLRGSRPRMRLMRRLYDGAAVGECDWAMADGDRGGVRSERPPQPLADRERAG
jgi:ribosomal protein S18 acetylase RimI-like enzyme